MNCYRCDKPEDQHPEKFDCTTEEERELAKEYGTHPLHVRPARSDGEAFRVQIPGLNPGHWVPVYEYDF